MREITKKAFQGDIQVKRVDKLPEGLREVAAKNARYVVAHSETGHHHTIDANGCKLYQGEEPRTAYLVMETVEHADVIHNRSFDTHVALRLLGGTGSVWKIRRQREYTPQGDRDAQD